MARLCNWLRRHPYHRPIMAPKAAMSRATYERTKARLPQSTLEQS